MNRDLMNADQYEFQSAEWWRAQAMQLSMALEAVMVAHGIGQGIFGGWYVYQCADGGADTFPVNSEGNRIVIPPSEADAALTVTRAAQQEAGT